MSSNTTNYNLVKPADDEIADISVINNNMDTIDTAMQSLADNKEAVLKDVTEKTSVVDGDSMTLLDSADSSKTKKISFSNFKSVLRTYFDTVYTWTSLAKLANNLTITTEGSALDAVQGKVLSDSIAAVNSSLSVVTDDRGYVGSTVISSGSIDDVRLKGKYQVGGDITGLPTTEWYFLDVNGDDYDGGTYLTQVITSFTSLKVYKRSRYYTGTGMGWSQWEEILTSLNGLPLTGGTLIGSITMPGTLTLTRTDNVNKTRLYTSGDFKAALQTWVDGSNWTSFYVGTPSATAHDLLLVNKTVNGVANISRIYHEGNITCSTIAPASALAEGAQHQVY